MSIAPVAASHLVWLGRSPASRTLVGGKGASLSQLALLGAPVPPAFALTTHAYAEFSASLDLPRHVGDVADEDLPRLRELIVASPLPTPIVESIAHGWSAFRTLASAEVALAVRSSATAEDSADSSCAGQHDTILDVRTLPSLEAAVKQCWASLWSERAVAYRRAMDLAGDEVAIAVVVQQLIQSDVSFIVFTRDPIGGRKDHVIISATWGLGEALVSGLVVPDHIVVDALGNVIEYRVGDKHLMVIPGAGAGAGEGVREVPVPRALRAVPALSHGQASSIAAMARELVPLLGYEADLEGALAGDALYLFQARPITTLTSLNLIESVAAAS